MTIRASEFDVMAAKVDSGELTENQVVWMAVSAGQDPARKIHTTQERRQR